MLRNWRRLSYIPFHSITLIRSCQQKWGVTYLFNLHSHQSNWHLAGRKASSLQLFFFSCSARLTDWLTDCRANFYIYIQKKTGKKQEKSTTQLDKTSNSAGFFRRFTHVDWWVLLYIYMFEAKPITVTHTPSQICNHRISTNYKSGSSLSETNFGEGMPFP